MSQLQIVEASAGSGKTYRLVFEYLRLLFINPENYRHILAVTFTNKATEEMKSRIILEIARLQHICNISCTQPCNKDSVYRIPLSEQLKLSPDEIAHKARKILHNILHNYSQFSILTIDSFFQQILRAFLREMGISTSTRIELDSDWVIQQAIDRLLLELDTDDQLYHWLIHYMLEQISQGKSWNLREKLISMAHELLNEKFLSLPSDYQQQLFSENFRQKFQLDVLYSIKNKYENFLREKAKDALDIIEKYHLSEDDFNGKSKGIVNFFRKLVRVNYDNLRIDPKFADVENWPHKTTRKKDAVTKALLEGGLFVCYQTIVDFMNKNQLIYNDVQAILKNIHTYGVLADVGHAIDRVLKDNDIQLLSKTTQFIHKLVSQNDAPFIYEKIARLLRHFIIDEFQDTSYIQWQNFRPFISECLANDNFAMVVGDIKQSIYRWRNTDWTILEHKAESDMYAHGTRRSTLDTNWRSLPEIVAFNNDFFGNYLVTYNENLHSIYRSVKQTCAYRGDASGMVYINVNIEKDNEESNDEDENIPASAVEWTIQQILTLLSKGYRQKDIAILVREKKEGMEITKAINAYNQSHAESQRTIHVLSTESTLLTQCVAINLIIEAFAYLLNPYDSVNLAALSMHYQIVRRYIDSHASTDVTNHLLEPLLNKLNDLMLNNPLDLFEEMVHVFQLNHYPSFLPYLQAFHNFLHDFCINHTPHLKAFMDYWDHKKDNIGLEISENQDAVRILTIHKSKGLQFPNVIIPFCNWSLDYRGNQAPLLWCSAQHTPVEQLQYIPIRYAKELENTSFSGEYFKERTQYFIDNINLLYVAFTRPMHHLYIYVPQINTSNDCRTVGDWLYRYVVKSAQPSGSHLIFQQGTLQHVELSSLVSEHTDYQFKHYPVYSFVKQIKQKSAFGDILPQTMQYGNVMHRLFQYVHHVEDIEKAVDIIIAEGFIPFRERQSSILWLRKLLEQPVVNAWFTKEWKVFTEATVVAPFQHPYRPDRVMIKNSHAIVLDYKFGTRELSSYKTQLRKYMSFLHDMGYKPVEGYLWYVQLEKVEKVE